MANEVKDEDLPITEEADGSVVVGNPEEPESDDKDEVDEKLATHDDDEDGHADETGEDAEARRERNRKRRAENKERRKDYVESLKRELAARDSIINDLSTRVAHVERQGVGSQLASLDGAIKESADAYNYFKNINKQAIEQANGQVAVDAQEKMFAAQTRYQQLTAAKQNAIKQQNAPQPLDPMLKTHAESWMKKNDWYDPSGTDMDSRVVLTLDDQLAKEGWNPKTAEYWEELETRKNKYLPHRKNGGYNKPQASNSRPRVPVAGGSGRETSNGGDKGSYRLSAERVNALKEAGLWDDPSKRADAVKRFKQYDADNSATR